VNHPSFAINEKKNTSLQMLLFGKKNGIMCVRLPEVEWVNIG
jgi:hypothetical protein